MTSSTIARPSGTTDGEHRDGEHQAEHAPLSPLEREARERARQGWFRRLFGGARYHVRRI